MEFGDVIGSRRSVRRFSKTPVEQGKLEYMLECARLAPSWSNRQCWHFVVVRDTDLLAELKGALNMFNRVGRDAPAMVAACGDSAKSGTHHGVDYWAVDVAIAMEHLVLAATDVGLGTCWMGVFDESALRRILGIPDGIKVAALSPVGYPADKTDHVTRMAKAMVGRERKPLEDIAHWDGW